MPLSALAMMTWSNGPASLLGGISLAMFLLGGFVTAMSLRYVLNSRNSDLPA
jgi:hypothetical protein